MFLSENIKKENIIIDIKVKNRWEIIDAMIDLAEKNKTFTSDAKEEIKKALIKREKTMSTGIGNGVAIPHCSTDKINDITIIMALTSKGINFDSIDNLPVKIVILLLVPETKLSKHVKILANIAKTIGNDDFRESLFDLKTPIQIVKKIKSFTQENE